ncbi:MAG: winged helix-turn-helix transcriptional regulator [Robiginitomaculum sp.]|nr:winged helix-turn-helix transcriptional regulator [Robiginitomaculum sp.]
MRNFKAKVQALKTYRQIPPKVEYSLTEFGLTLDPILKALENWGAEYIDKITELPDCH